MQLVFETRLRQFAFENVCLRVTDTSISIFNENQTFHEPFTVHPESPMVFHSTKHGGPESQFLFQALGVAGDFYYILVAFVFR